MIYHTLSLLASTYGSGSYDNSTYNGADAATSGNGGSLSDTGIAITVIITMAALILLTALVVRIWRRPKKAVEPVSVDGSDQLNR
jgi:hypothetical protein